jgi:hypothetical protein
MLSQGILTYRSLTVNPERLDRIGVRSFAVENGDQAGTPR